MDEEESMGLLDIRQPTEALQKTMRELGEMERRFQSVARRERLAVETSHLHIEVEPPANQTSMKPRPYTPRRGAISSSKPESASRSQDQTPLDGYDADLATGELDEAIEGTVERCASRPPPVNSDRLPLPWSGRLGYVREPITPRHPIEDGMAW